MPRGRKRPLSRRPLVCAAQPNSSADIPYAFDPFQISYRAAAARPVCHGGSGVRADDIDRGVNRMSVHRREFSEATNSIPQDWASLAHYLARRGIELGPGPPRQFAGGYGNLNYLIEIDGTPAVLRRPPAG